MYNLSLVSLSFIVFPFFFTSNPLSKLSQHTVVKENTCNPVFQEILTFPLREDKIANSHSKVSIWDKNQAGEDEFLGETIIDLCKLNLNSGSSLWYNLKPQVIESCFKFLKCCEHCELEISF